MIWNTINILKQILLIFILALIAEIYAFLLSEFHKIIGRECVQTKACDGSYIVFQVETKDEGTRKVGGLKVTHISGQNN